jgi:hypothetical protein
MMNLRLKHPDILHKGVNKLVKLPNWKKEEFIERYNQLKSQHLPDVKIAEKMFISKNTLYSYKKKYDVPMITQANKELINDNGLTREWLNVAKSNGLTSSTVNMRIREYQWSVEEACTIEPLPIGRKMMKGGERVNAINK